MSTENWQQQGKEPLFPNLLWSRPETKLGAGKLLIIGGQAQSFTAVAGAFAAAEKAGAGTIRVIMPESTRKSTQFLPNIEYAPSNTSGSFAKTALASFFDASEWADGVLLAGDLGRNSETTTILDGYMLKCPAFVTIPESALSSINLQLAQLAQRPINLVLKERSLQKLLIGLGSKKPLTSTTPMPAAAEILAAISKTVKANTVSIFNDKVWIASRGKVSSTPVAGINIVELAAASAVWSMQNPPKMFEALTCVAYEFGER